jgi:hypothetical protein
MVGGSPARSCPHSAGVCAGFFREIVVTAKTLNDPEGPDGSETATGDNAARDTPAVDGNGVASAHVLGLMRMHQQSCV